MIITPCCFLLFSPSCLMRTGSPGCKLGCRCVCWSKYLFCDTFALSSLNLSCSWFTPLGVRRLGIIVSLVRRRRPNANSAGLFLKNGMGVALYVNKAKCWSFCCKIFFAVCTALSASPFACG